MMMDSFRGRIVLCCLVAGTGLISASAQAQTRLRPGFNLFSVDQDREIGSKSATEAERQLPILDDRSTTQFIDAVGQRLAAVAPGAKYQYQFKVVNVSDINAFALPGGYIYLNRGLIEAARTEGELAGVMAHEMAHVALRHGTNQASKAYLSQAGLGLLGGFVDNPSTQKTINSVGGFGLNTLFLKFSRADERQADIAGSQILAKSGYNPMDMVTFFQALEASEARNPGKVEQFFSSHPQLSDRAARVQAEMKSLNVRVTAPVGGFKEVKAELRAMSPSPTMEQVSQGRAGDLPTGQDNGADGNVAGTGVAVPSTEFVEFRQRDGFFRIQRPSDWKTYQSGQGYGVTIAPDGGYVVRADGEKELVYGVIVNHYDPFDGGTDGGLFPPSNTSTTRGSAVRGSSFADNSGEFPIERRSTLVAATDDLVRQLLRTNPSLRQVQQPARVGKSEGEPVMSILLTGRSPISHRDEMVSLITRRLPDDHVIYVVFVSPSASYESLRPTFTRMMSSLQVDSVAHDHQQARQ